METANGATDQEIRVESPGRINIIGEHTDYNNGFVLPAAIDKKIRLRFRKNNSVNLCSLFAEDKQEQFELDLNNIRPIESGWQNYVLGVVAELQSITNKITGFDCSFGGDVPIGSGMSSSAALECGVAMGLNELFDLGLSKEQMMFAAQKAEHNFVGTLCGIMDQFASMMGRKDAAILLDCKTMEYQYFPLDLGKHTFLFLNTNIEHSLADTAYNTRRQECETGVRILRAHFPEIESLRDVELVNLNKFKNELPPTVFQRCSYVLLENQRVIEAAQAMEKKDFEQLGQLLYQSHMGLQNDYEVSCQELDFLVRQTLDKDYIPGARMMGGGFGGCTINLIEKTKVDSFTDEVARNYRQQFGIDLSPYTISISDGTRII